MCSVRIEKNIFNIRIFRTSEKNLVPNVNVSRFIFIIFIDCRIISNKVYVDHNKGLVAN